ncbi:hypothetical protein JS86_25715 [Vibrio vulnificus]|nr:hypothetical protein JS86_25715 [Vibrio vulnificus]
MKRTHAPPTTGQTTISSKKIRMINKFAGSEAKKAAPGGPAVNELNYWGYRPQKTLVDKKKALKT